MPRTPTGFQRTNGEFDVGDEIWGQDLAADIKIIASRHDIHDQDIADAIFMSLPRDGSQPMLSALNMGNNAINNVAAMTLNELTVTTSLVSSQNAVFNGPLQINSIIDFANSTIINFPDEGLPADIARLGDLITSGSFDLNAELMTLSRNDAPDIIIDMAGVNGGTGGNVVTSISAGSGLAATPNPIVNTGTIFIPASGVVPGTYSSADVTVNSQGIITAIGNGSGGGTVSDVNVTASQSSSFLRMTVDVDGVTDSANLPAVTNASFGVVTPSQKATWDGAASLNLGYSPQASSGIITHDKSGNDATIPLWDGAEDEAGLFAGVVTGTAPTAGASTTKPKNFVWFVV